MILTKEKKMRTKFIKIIYHKFRLRDRIKNKENSYKRANNNKK
jgi:hypothetical protein